MSTDIPPLKTRKPSGKPPWPLVLLAGLEKAGKSYSAAAFSASDLIDRTFWVEIGEGAADQYGAMPGARYEIVEHDGSYIGIGRALRAATQQPRPTGKPHAIVVDSMTELWDLLSEEAQQTANVRKKKGPDGEAQITMDLWNVAKKRWRHILDLLRTYDGPVILTARLDQVAVMDANGKPTTEREYKVRSEKNLAFECDVVVKLFAPERALVTGARSLLLNTGADGLKVADFTLDTLMKSLGLSVESTSPRSYVAPRAAPQVGEEPLQTQRERPSAPQADEWSTPATEQPQFATDPQVRQIAVLVKDKRGIGGSRPADRELRLAVVGAIVGHLVHTSKQLTLREASHVIKVLSAEPDFDPQQYVGQEMVRQHEEAHVDLSDASPAAVAEAERLEGLPGGASVEDVLRDRLESAGDPGMVTRVWQSVLAEEEANRIDAAGFERLTALRKHRLDELEADRGWSHRRLAEKTGAAA